MAKRARARARARARVGAMAWAGRRAPAWAWILPTPLGTSPRTWATRSTTGWKGEVEIDMG